VARALVTGGSGYFGSIVVQELLARGNDVRVLDRFDATDRPRDVEFICADIRDADAVARACQDVDVIHHNVAQVPLAKDSHLFWSVNVDGTRVLLDAAQRARARKVVLVSSSAVFGVPAKNPVDDAVPPRPREAYGRAKLEAERLARDFSARGLDVTIIRPRTILGHGRLGIFEILFDWVRRGLPVYTLGSGHNRYQFVHADDLAAACIRAGELAGARTFNIGAERFGTIRQLLTALITHAGSGSPIRALPARPAIAIMDATSRLGLSPLGAYHSLMYGREMFFDITPAKRELGYAPRYSNEEMIVQSYDHFLARADDAAPGGSPHRSPVRRGILRLLELLG
jgi:nucleoside-diphosphate-sugar epimerase